MKQIGLGMIGCGGMGNLHSSVAKELGVFTLVACADTAADKAGKLAETYGYGKAYIDYHELLQRTDVEAVIVALPHSLLKEATLEALKAGKHVFVEKPMALNRFEAKELVEASEKTGLNLMVGYCLRYYHGRLLMKRLLEEGIVGEPQLIIAAKGFELIRPEQAPAQAGWLGNPATGGGIMLYLGSHLIDQVLWMMKSPVERVYAEANLHHALKVDVTVPFTARFRNGVLATFNCSALSYGGYDFIEVIGRDGQIRQDWGYAGKNTLHVHTRNIEEYGDPTLITLKEDPGRPMYVCEIKEFAESITERRKPAITAEDGLKVLEVIDAVFESARGGQPVDLPS